MRVVRPISVKPTLLNESGNFLNQENMSCSITTEGMVELISQLIHYREEGKILYPEIYIFDDLDLVKKVLPTSQSCIIGSGEKSKETMLKALKKCAPLTERGWSIYILRKSDTFEYGVIRAGTSILSVPISEHLIDNGSSELKSILIHQISEKVIEVKGVTADSLIISFGNQSGIANSPIQVQQEFIEAILKNTKEKIKDPTKNFFQKVFLDVLQKGHGTLSCVINSKRKYPKILQDGIILVEKLKISNIVEELLNKSDLEANSKLEGSFFLLSGMLQSDGITVFSDSGEILSYNVFIKHRKKFSKSGTNGGARSRTYLTLCDMLGKGIDSTFIQSQDGHIESMSYGQ